MRLLRYARNDKFFTKKQLVLAKLVVSASAVANIIGNFPARDCFSKKAVFAHFQGTFAG
jgi:hypothetical protein